MDPMRLKNINMLINDLKLLQQPNRDFDRAIHLLMPVSDSRVIYDIPVFNAYTSSTEAAYSALNIVYSGARIVSIHSKDRKWFIVIDFFGQHYEGEAHTIGVAIMVSILTYEKNRK